MKINHYILVNGDKKFLTVHEIFDTLEEGLAKENNSITMEVTNLNKEEISRYVELLAKKIFDNSFKEK